VLKIDKSFVEGITASEQRLALVKGIVSIASTMGIAIVAEGIETDQQYQLLTEMGCQYGQGFLLARPVSWEDGQRLLRSNQPLIAPSASAPSQRRYRFHGCPVRAGDHPLRERSKTEVRPEHPTSQRQYP
jgi:predicted signal transduction protein with EAL and GGDEF domain